MADHKQTASDSPDRQLPPFAALRAFEAVFRLGGIRKAAQELGLNHSVVSRHIRHLEAWLGGALVNRAGNRLTLTADGARLHARAAAAIGDLKDACAEFSGLNRDGPLKLWCVPGLSIQWLAREIADFERNHAYRQIELKPSEMAADFAAHEADADVRYHRDDETGGTAARGLKLFEIARPQVHPVASPELADQLKERLDENGLAHLPYLHEESDAEWRSWLAKNRMPVPPRLPGLKCWHAHLLVAAAREGRGVALASRMLVDADLREGRLVPLPIAGTGPVSLGAYVLAAREDRWSDATLSGLRDWLRRRALRFIDWSP